MPRSSSDQLKPRAFMAGESASSHDGNNTMKYLQMLEDECGGRLSSAVDGGLISRRILS